MLRLDQLAPAMGVESWIIMAGGAFLLSLCFLVSFIAADAWMSRQPISLRSICSSVLELYESRGEITYNEKWQKSLVACVMTAQSRSARDKRDPIRHASSTDHGARRPHAPGCLQRAPGGEAGGGEELGQIDVMRCHLRTPDDYGAPHGGR